MDANHEGTEARHVEQSVRRLPADPFGDGSGFWIETDATDHAEALSDTRVSPLPYFCHVPPDDTVPGTPNDDSWTPAERAGPNETIIDREESR